MGILIFLAQNWDNAFLICAFICGVVTLYKREETRLIKEILFKLVTRAEAEFGSGTGELKRAAVIEWLYERLPAPMRLFISAKQMDALLGEVLEYAKAKWAANKKLREYIENAAP